MLIEKARVFMVNLWLFYKFQGKFKVCYILHNKTWIYRHLYELPYGADW